MISPVFLNVYACIWTPETVNRFGMEHGHLYLKKKKKDEEEKKRKLHWWFPMLTWEDFGLAMQEARLFPETESVALKSGSHVHVRESASPAVGEWTKWPFLATFEIVLFSFCNSVEDINLGTTNNSCFPAIWTGKQNKTICTGKSE